jgi:hypothetical protein
MSKLERLRTIAEEMRSEISSIRDFARETDTTLATKSPGRPDTPFTSEEKEELKNVSAALLAATASPTPTGEIVLTTTVSEKVGHYLLQIMSPVKQRSFLAEMALAYLLSYLEGFVKDYLLQVLVDNPRMLRSGATLSHEQALSYQSMKHLRRGLAEQEVESLGYGSIDDIGAYFMKKLNVSLAAFERWPDIREHAYRRNIIIHNKARINETYRKKVNYKGSRARLHTDMAYVVGAATNMLALIDFIHSETTKRLKLK